MKCNKEILLLIFLIALTLTGCYNLRLVPVNDVSMTVGKSAIVYTNDTSIYVTHLESKEDFFTGMIDSIPISVKDKKLIHIYVVRDFSILRSGNQITIPFTRISRIDRYKINGLKTTIFAGGTVFLSTIAISILVLIIGGGYDL